MKVRVTMSTPVRVPPMRRHPRRRCRRRRRILPRRGHGQARTPRRHTKVEAFLRGAMTVVVVAVASTVKERAVAEGATTETAAILALRSAGRLIGIWGGGMGWGGGDGSLLMLLFCCEVCLVVCPWRVVGFVTLFVFKIISNKNDGAHDDDKIYFFRLETTRAGGT